MSRQHLPEVDLPRTHCSATCTYRKGEQVISLVGRTIPECHAEAHKRLGDGVECLSVSTPRTIYNDLTGETQQRQGALGLHKRFSEELMPSERAASR